MPFTTPLLSQRGNGGRRQFEAHPDAGVVGDGLFGPIVWIGINDWSAFGARTWIEDDLTENHAGEIAVTREDIIDTSGIGAIQGGYTDRAVLIRDGRLLAQRVQRFRLGVGIGVDEVRSEDALILRTSRFRRRGNGPC